MKSPEENNVPDTPGSETGQRRGVLASVDAGVRAAANFLTFGLADKLAARGDQLVSGGKYEDHLKRQQDITAHDAKHHSGAVAMGQVSAVAVAIVPNTVRAGLGWAGTKALGWVAGRTEAAAVAGSTARATVTTAQAGASTARAAVATTEAAAATSAAGAQSASVASRVGQAAVNVGKATVEAAKHPVAAAGNLAKGGLTLAGHIAVPAIVVSGGLAAAEMLVETTPISADQSGSHVSVDNKMTATGVTATVLAGATVAATAVAGRYAAAGSLIKSGFGQMFSNGLVGTSLIGKTMVAGEGLSTAYVEDKLSGDPSLLTQSVDSLRTGWVGAQVSLMEGGAAGKFALTGLNTLMDTYITTPEQLKRKEDALLHSGRADFSSPAVQQLGAQRIVETKIEAHRNALGDFDIQVTRGVLQGQAAPTEEEARQMLDEHTRARLAEWRDRWRPVHLGMTQAEQQQQMAGQATGPGQVIPVSAPAPEAVDMGRLNRASGSLAAPSVAEPPKTEPASVPVAHKPTTPGVM
jgi:hypothetical protein